MFHSITDVYQDFEAGHGSEHPAWTLDDLRSWLHSQGHTRYEDITSEIVGQAIEAEQAEQQATA